MNAIVERPAEACNIHTPVNVVEAVSASPSLLILTVKPRADYFAGNIRVISGQESGFKWAPNRFGIGMLAVLDHDLGEPLALMKVHGGAEAVGQLSCIEIHIDPERSPIEWGAGTRLMAICAKFADLMAGTLCDGLGNVIDQGAREALAEHINSVMQRRREAGRAPRVLQPDGRLRQEGDLSFIATYYTRRGAYIGAKHFECEPGGWYEGDIEGLNMARELFDYVRLHKTNTPDIEEIIIGAVAAINEKRLTGDNEKTRARVARGFLKGLVGMAIFGARNSNYGAWLDSNVAREREGAAWMAARKEKDRAEFVERMQAAKVAKKARREGGGA